MPRPDPLRQILERSRRGLKPFRLVGPDDREYLAETYEGLVRVTMHEFDPVLAGELEALLSRRPAKKPPSP